MHWPPVTVPCFLPRFGKFGHARLHYAVQPLRHMLNGTGSVIQFIHSLRVTQFLQEQRIALTERANLLSHKRVDMRQQSLDRGVDLTRAQPIQLQFRNRP